ncbi:MAG: FHA domain-containing protein [Coriobacteriaceae bacterium]|nr:FHA domain-containing protein [Coriobacteriaceae bacterium]MDO4890501.1 FHA domain-containing protein [Coriobacteriaceae bacterium]
MEKRCPVCTGAVSPLDTACPSCGFKLHGTTEEFKPVPLPHESGQVVPQPATRKPASLHVLKGPQVGITIGLPDTEGPLMVGRSPKCDVFLNDMTVSRRHAIIETTPSGWKITDQNSFNGIWINNKSITSAVLKNGDIIQIGAFCLRVDC